MCRRRSDLSLAVVQNQLKRDPGAYAEEFDALWRQYLSELAVLVQRTLDEGGESGSTQTSTMSLGSRREEEKRLSELASFVAHCGVHFEASRRRFGPELAALLSERGSRMAPETRLNMAQACLVAKSKGLFQDPLVCFELCFELVQIGDKPLRQLCKDYLRSEARRAKRNNGAYSRKLQRALVTNMGSETDRVAECALGVVMDLYKRRAWTDSTAVNALARACGDDRSRICRKAAAFFLGVDNQEEEDSDSDDNDDNERLRQARDAVGAHQHSKKTRSRASRVERSAKRATKLARKLAEPKPLFPAIDLLDDPLWLCERLLAKLRAQVDSFRTRLLLADLTSRVVAVHRIQLLPFYAWLARYLRPQQRDCTRFLAIFAQACHDLVPPDHLLPVVRAIADNFVSDRNASEHMALGINAIREIVGRAPALLDEEDMLGFARDLAAYSKHRDKSVVVAARGWINALRTRFPGLLRKKDRGKQHIRDQQPAKFGALQASDKVDGADLLAAYESHALPEGFEDVVEQCRALDDNGGDDDDEEDNPEEEEDDDAVGDDDDEDDDEEEDEEEEDDDDAGGDDDGEENDEEEEDDDEQNGDEEARVATAPAPSLDPLRLLSSTDFERIRLLKERAAELELLPTTKERVSAADIEAYATRRRASLAERKAKAERGREAFEHKLHAGGKTNAEKRRTKNYLMIQKKAQQSALSRKRGRAGNAKQQHKREKRKRRRL